MKPLIVIQFEGHEYAPEKQEAIDKALADVAQDYHVFVIWADNCKITVYNIPFYIKIKTWLIRKIWKRKLSSIISKTTSERS